MPAKPRHLQGVDFSGFLQYRGRGFRRGALYVSHEATAPEVRQFAAVGCGAFPRVHIRRSPRASQCVGQDRTNVPNRIHYDNFRRSMCAFFPCKADACTMQLHRPQIKSISINSSQGTSLCTSMIRTCVDEQGPTFGFCSVRGPSLCEKTAKARGLSVPGIRFQKFFNFF
jgi:hypothetical protein